ncbi:Uncharacterised protein [Escherichia coli]|nr:Uncharacterised protein [Escherichia coli]
MNLNEMLKALSPKRESLTLGGFTFYARPMSVQEFNEHVFNTDKKTVMNALFFVVLKMKTVSQYLNLLNKLRHCILASAAN